MVILEWEALGFVLGISGFSVLAVWSRDTILAHPRNYNLTQWGWIELDYSYRLIVDVMTPSCG